VMLGNAEIIASHPNCSRLLAEHARAILDAGEKGVSLATNFMDFANPGPSSSKVLRPAPVIASQLPMLETAVGERHSVVLETAPCEGRILIDPAQLERLVLNLVMNARDAMPEGGAVNIHLQSVSALDDDGKPGQFFRISVQDHGVGIPAEVLPRIFEPYFTTKPRGQGTGVGLAVVQQIASYAGGFVRVKSTPGLGSSFHVFLPHISNG
jgi:two-component system cell cycle sensor histidine kinase/response regulator CckA